MAYPWTPLRISHPGRQAGSPLSAAMLNWPSALCFWSSSSHFCHHAASLVYFVQHTLWAVGWSVQSNFIWTLQKPSTLVPSTRCEWPSWALWVCLWENKNVAAAGAGHEMPTQVPLLMERKSSLACLLHCRQLWSNELLFQDLSSDLLWWQIGGYQPHLFGGNAGSVRCWEGCQWKADHWMEDKAGESQCQSQGK